MKKHFQTGDCLIFCGDSREVLPTLQIKADLIVTSPPYADARKSHYDSIHPDRYADWLLSFSDAFWNSLVDDGSLILNIKDKVVSGMRHRFVWDTIESFAKKGWHCIDDYIWHKTNPMPGRWPNRLRDGWEYCFHLAKTSRPYFNPDNVRKPIGDWVNTRLANLSESDLRRHNSENKSGFGRNISKWLGKTTVLPSNVISLPLVGKNKGHPAVYPVDLPLFFIKLLSRKGHWIIDPFSGSGTTGIAALSAGRKCILIDSYENYCELAKKRISEEVRIIDEEIKQLQLFEKRAKYTVHQDKS
jgi:site-specific DNA-methyltransferase (adenine-specific)/site-specific DNA-methyltransferase (cytosine-N4-specific)